MLGALATRTPAANDAHVRNDSGHKNTPMNEPTDLLYIMQEMFLTGPTTRNDGIWIIEKKVKRHKRTASICIYTRRDFATPNGNDRCHFLGGASLPRIIENTVFRFAFDDLIIRAAPANQPNTGTHLTTNRLKTGLFAMLHRSSWCFCASENVHRSWALGNNYTETEADKHLFIWQRKKRTWHRQFFLDARKLTPRWSWREKAHTKTELTNRVKPTSWCTIWAILQKRPKPDTQTDPTYCPL